MKKRSHSQKKRTSRNYKAWAVGIAMLFVIGMGGIIAGCGDSSDTAETPPPSVSAVTEPSPSATVTPPPSSSTASTPSPALTPSPSPSPEEPEPVQETPPANTPSVPEPEDPSALASVPPVSSVAPSVPAAPEPNEPEPSVSQAAEQVAMVWISGSGKKYHSNPNCSNMKNPQQVSIDEAIAAGRTACSKCY